MTRSILLSLLVLGCGGGGNDDDGMMMQPDAAMNEPTINGKPASQFYAQFAHATTKNEVAGAASFPAQPDGRNAFHASFFLMPDSKLVLFYAEAEGEVTATGHSLAIFNNTKKKRMGTWRIEGAQLVLDSYMRCDGFAFNGKDVLRCTLSSAIITPAAQGRAGTFQNGIGAASPDDSEFADYVP
ncbi:MAG: hypothetical protein M4D80_23615 [Myxococcota bacterium]|nr:hypothetical protein [Myxococcota bacterium]